MGVHVGCLFVCVFWGVPPDRNVMVYAMEDKRT